MRSRLSLKGQGLQLLAQRDHSRLELRRKLLKHARADLQRQKDDAARRSLAAAGDLDGDADADGDSHRLNTDARVASGARGSGGFRGSRGAPGAAVSMSNAAVAPLAVRAADAGRSGQRPPAGGVHVGPRHGARTLTTADAHADADAGTGIDTDTDTDTQAADAEPEAAAGAPSPEEAVDAVLDWLQAHRYLDEGRFVEGRVHARASRFGNLRIRQELAQHGVTMSADDVQALKHSELSRAREVWQRKFGDVATDPGERARQMRFLGGRGFSPDVIRRVVRGGGDPDD